MDKIKVCLLAFSTFSLGYMVSDLNKESTLSLFPQAHADVAGMDAYDLRSDYDFKKAVRYVVENNCSVYDDYISC